MNSTPWLIFNDTPHSAAWNMACDEVLLEDFQAKIISYPVLRFYQFQTPSITIGYGMRQKSVKETELPIVRRFTGGGWVYHDQDLVYSLVAPIEGQFEKLEESYEHLHLVIQKAFSVLGLQTDLAQSKVTSFYFGKPCFKVPVNHDLVYRDQKIAGGAQRRLKDCFLHQGSIDWSRVSNLVTLDQFTSILETEFANYFNVEFLNFENSFHFNNKVEHKEKEKYSALNWNERI